MTAENIAVSLCCGNGCQLSELGFMGFSGLEIRFSSECTSHLGEYAVNLGFSLSEPGHYRRYNLPSGGLPV